MNDLIFVSFFIAPFLAFLLVASPILGVAATLFLIFIMWIGQLEHENFAKK